MASSPEQRRAALLRGAAAEARIASLLEGEGWSVLVRNWIGGGGELDLVVRRGRTLRMVEVKLREADDPVGVEAIDDGKRRRLRGAAGAWLALYDEPIDEVCFLVALVEGDAVSWIDDAFDG